MYRMNCNLSDDIGARLWEYCERTGVAKVTVLSLALDQYLNEQEVKRKLLEQFSDPVQMAEICKIMGVSAPGSKQ